MDGGEFALTVTWKAQLAWLSALSKATQTTPVMPDANALPDAGLHDVFLIPEPSVAVNVNVATAVPPLPVGLRFWLTGHAIVGGVVSTTKTEN